MYKIRTVTVLTPVLILFYFLLSLISLYLFDFWSRFYKLFSQSRTTTAFFLDQFVGLGFPQAFGTGTLWSLTSNWEAFFQTLQQSMRFYFNMTVGISCILFLLYLNNTWVSCLKSSALLCWKESRNKKVGNHLQRCQKQTSAFILWNVYLTFIILHENISYFIEWVLKNCTLYIFVSWWFSSWLYLNRIELITSS